MKNKKLKDKKALSGIIAEIICIILIAIFAVVLVSYAGKLTNQMTQHPQQATITDLNFISSSSVNATVQNIGTDNVTLQTATIDGNAAIIAYTGNQTSLTVTPGNTGYFTITLTNSNTFQNGDQYTLTLTTAEGKTFDYAEQYISNPPL